MLRESGAPGKRGRRGGERPMVTGSPAFAGDDDGEAVAARAIVRLASRRGAPHSDPVKIATFNINNINKRLPNLTAWLRAAEPDVVCLQELKSTDAEFPASALARAGYEAVWRGQKSWNGVAILARGVEP